MDSSENASIEIPAGTVMHFGGGRFILKDALRVEGTPEDLALLQTQIYPPLEVDGK